MVSMTTRSMAKLNSCPAVVSSPVPSPVQKGFDNLNDPKKIAGITIPTSDGGWHMRLNQIEKFIETHHKNAINGERMESPKDIAVLQKYTNFLAVSKRHWLFTDDHHSNGYRGCKLLKNIQRLNKLV